MKQNRSLSLILALVIMLTLLSGCEINISIGNQQDAAETTEKITETTNPTPTEPSKYTCSATILISNSALENAGSISSSDLTASLQMRETICRLLQTDRVLDSIRKKYPDAKFDIKMEMSEDTGICTVIATSENKENLKDICNMAVDRLCEVGEDVIEDAFIRIVDLAAEPKKAA